MGYRSDVTFLFYAEEKEYPILKLWVDENLKRVLVEREWCFDNFKDWGREFIVSDLAVPRDDLNKVIKWKGYSLVFEGVKWYESDPDVAEVEGVWKKFAETFSGHTPSSEAFCPSIAGERATIGEDYNDVEYGRTEYAENFLKVRRVAEF